MASQKFKTLSEVEQRNIYLRMLFNPGEGVNYAATLYDTKVITLETAFEMPILPRIAKNPLFVNRDNEAQGASQSRFRGRRDDCNVSAFRNFLIEGDKTSVDEQAQELADKKVPYSVLTFSGTKSLHAVICLSDGCDNAEEYAEIFKLLSWVVRNMDVSVAPPSGLTRAPNGVNDKNGAQQTLVDVRRRIPKAQLLKWLSRFSAHIERKQTFQEQGFKKLRDQHDAYLASLPPGAKGMQLISPYTKKVLSGEKQLGVGDRHRTMVAIASNLAEVGVDYYQALQLMSECAANQGVAEIRGRHDEASRIVQYAYKKVGSY